MNEFLKLVYELVGNIIKNIFGFFASIYYAFVKLFSADIYNYYETYTIYYSGFSIGQKILAICLALLLAGILLLLIWRIALAVKKWWKLRKEKIEKEDLLHEIGILNRQVVDLIDEKNKIMAMRVSQLGLTPGDSEELYAKKYEKNRLAEMEKKQGTQDHPIRFPKLDLVDKKYREYQTPEFANDIDLAEFVERFRNFASSRMKLYYELTTIRYFVAGMATSKLLILEGISGTGKTSLPYSFSRFMQNPATIISVQPSYRDRTELLGYFNEFTKRFNETEFLRSVYEAGKRQDPNFVVLDEMNLARIEYYFADMLSVLEMPTADEWVVDLVPVGWKNDPTDLLNGKLQVPTNIWFIGTANNDDSTFTITDKVYDRSIPIEINARGIPFAAPDTSPLFISDDHLQDMFEKAIETFPMTDAMRVKLGKLDEYLMTRFKLAFGNRIMKQIEKFVPVFIACGGSEMEALDYIITRKILKKFESLNIAYVRDEIKELVAFIEKVFGKTALAESKKYLLKIQNMF